MPDEQRTYPPSDEMLRVVYDRTERFEHALFGNGQPGLLDRVSRIETQASITRWFGAAFFVALLAVAGRLIAR